MSSRALPTPLRSLEPRSSGVSEPAPRELLAANLQQARAPDPDDVTVGAPGLRSVRPERRAHRKASP
jgi:hypothetical protein